MIEETPMSDSQKAWSDRCNNLVKQNVDLRAEVERLKQEQVVPSEWENYSKHLDQIAPKQEQAEPIGWPNRCELAGTPESRAYSNGWNECLSDCKQAYATARKQEQAEPETAMVDAAMVEMKNIVPPLRRSECLRLIRAALSANTAPKQEQVEPVANAERIKVLADTYAAACSEFAKRIFTNNDGSMSPLAVEAGDARAALHDAIDAAPQDQSPIDQYHLTVVLLRQALEALEESRDDVAELLAQNSDLAGYERYDRRIAAYTAQLEKHDAAIQSIKQHLGKA